MMEEEEKGEEEKDGEKGEETHLFRLPPNLLMQRNKLPQLPLDRGFYVRISAFVYPFEEIHGGFLARCGCFEDCGNCLFTD